jgi:hypothetical protein
MGRPRSVIGIHASALNAMGAFVVRSYTMVSTVDFSRAGSPPRTP